MILLGRRASRAREVTLCERRKPAYDASRESRVIKKTQFTRGNKPGRIEKDLWSEEKGIG